MADQYQSLYSETALSPVAAALIAGSSIGRVEEGVIVITGSAAYPRGTIMGKITASSKYTGLTPGASDGSQTPAGVLGIATDAATGDIAAFIYKTGEFNRDLCLDGAGVAPTTAAIATLEGMNIYLRKVY